MTQQNNYPNGMPSWIDLTTTDIEGAKSFYSGLLGWSYTGGQEEFGGYLQVLKDGQVVAGMNPMAEAGMNVWSLYFSVDDITKTCDSIRESGGTLIAEPMPVGDLGHMAIATHAAAGTFGLWQGGTFKGADAFNKPGALTWEDLRSTNAIAAQEFFNKVFGYRYDDLPMPVPGDYKTFAFPGGEQPLGGMGAMLDTEGSPSHWLVYLRCDDSPTAEAYVRANGGNVITETAQTPFGQQCMVTDPFGATFCLIDTKTDQ